MRILSLFAALLVFPQFLSAQTWQSRANYDGDGRHHPICVANDQYGYMIAGSQGSLGFNLDEVHRYDPSTDSWSQLDAFPGSARGFAYGVNEGDNAYLGFGSDNEGYPTDWWHFDMATETWTSLAEFPGDGRNHPALVLVDGHIYVGCGSNGQNLNDWWGYDIANDSWEELPGFPGLVRHHPFYFGIDGKAYVGFGHGNNVNSNLVIFNDFYAYDPATETWEQLADFPGEARVAGTQFSANGKGYILSGDGDDHGPLDYGEFWEYDATTDTWTELPPHPGGARWAPGTFVIGCHVYLTSGLVGDVGNYPNDLMRFSIGDGCGCTDATAFNYDEAALFDDDSCCFESGCTDPVALNFDPDACFDDGSCETINLGCTDPDGTFFDPDANLQAYAGGPLTLDQYGTGGFHYNDSWEMVFDVSEPTLLTSIDVNVDNPGTFTLDIQTSTGAVILEEDFTVTSGWNTLQLDLELPQGTNHTIGVTGNDNGLGLYRNDAVPFGTFPIQIADRISISGNTTDSPQAFFYYFYNWMIEAPCEESVGIGELTATEWSLYPNPANKQVTVSGLSGTYALQVLDAQGRIVRALDGLNGLEILQVEDLSPGLYTVQILRDAKVSTQPLLIHSR